MKKIFILDSANFLFRSYYAIAPMTNPAGESTNALFGYIRSLLKIIKDFNPDHLVAVFDGPDNKKSRTALYADYKGHRKAMPEDLLPQLIAAQEFCRLSNIAMLQVAGVEADDTIGSITEWAEKNGYGCCICSSDKDLCQLVSSTTFVLNPFKDNLLIDTEKVKEIFGVYPKQMTDYLAMVGDASDNIPGLEGFGPKTVAALLSEHGSLNALLEDPSKISGKKKETLITQQEIALLSKQLATIQTDVEVPKDISFYQFAGIKGEPVKEFYRRMHFMSLLKELEIHEPKNKVEEQERKKHYETIIDMASLSSLILTLAKEKELCIDLETTQLDPLNAEIVGIGLGTTSGKCWYIPCNGNLEKTKVLAELRALLAAKGVRFFGHNIKYDMHVLMTEGLLLPSLCFDTLIASYVLNPSQTKHSLDYLALEKLAISMTPIEALIGKGKEQKSMAEVDIEKVAAYCCEDVDCTVQLRSIFSEAIQEENLATVFYDIEMPLIPVLMKMERNGVFIDTKLLSTMSLELNDKIAKLEKKIFAFSGEEFNVNSPKQLSGILFDKMGLKPPKKTTTGFSTSAEVLEILKEESPIVEKIIEYRTLEKLRSTYVDALPTFINRKTNRIHCTFNQSVTATGRLSCQDPNLQNIPIRGEEGKKIRQAFIPEKEGFVLVSADYSQIELRLLAHFCKDPTLIKAFATGQDIHSFTAAEVFNVPIEFITPDMRHQAKAVNFGILYGQQAFGLSRELSIDIKEASQFIQTYFQRYPNVQSFLDDCKKLARDKGFSTTLTGRKRPIPEIDSKNSMLRAAAERLAVNTPLQGTAADLIKIAMVRIDKELAQNPHLGKMILQIHDELIFEVEEKNAQDLAKIVKKIMESVFKLEVPLLVDISIGKNWGEC